MKEERWYSVPLEMIPGHIEKNKPVNEFSRFIFIGCVLKCAKHQNAGKKITHNSETAHSVQCCVCLYLHLTSGSKRKRKPARRLAENVMKYFCSVFVGPLFINFPHFLTSDRFSKLRFIHHNTPTCLITFPNEDIKLHISSLNNSTVNTGKHKLFPADGPPENSF